MSPSTSQIRDQIVAGVFPTLAYGNTLSLTVVCENLTRHYKTQNPSENCCQGILAKKDLVDSTVQGGISHTRKYFLNSNYDGYKFSIVKGTSTVLSIFCAQCTGESNTVR